MAKYMLKPIADLTRQLKIAPAKRQVEDIERIEQYYWTIQPDKLYPFDEVMHSITGYRPERGGSTSLVGEVLQMDLTQMVMDISIGLGRKATDFEPPAIDAKDLAEQLNVSNKTLDRYRKQGLFAQKLIFPDGRKRIGYPPESLERFMKFQKPKSERAARYQRLTDEQKLQLIEKARDLAIDGLKPQQVARLLAEEVGHTAESMRLLIRNHDKQHPERPIFPDHTPPLSEKQKRIIHRAYHRNIPVATLASRFGKHRDAIYRTINLKRAESIQALDIFFIDHPWFHLEDADSFIFEQKKRYRRSSNRWDDTLQQAPGALPEQFHMLFDLDPLPEEREQDLFIRFNYLKYRATEARELLDKYRPRSTDLDQIQTWLRQASMISRELALHHLRHLMSTARQHVPQNRNNETQELMRLIRTGLPLLLMAIEDFDVTKGGRFDTYLNWQLRKHFATGPHDMQTLSDDLDWPIYLNPTLAALSGTENILAQLESLLAELPPIEQRLITMRLGLGGMTRQQPLSLSDVADALKIPVKEARRLEKLTLAHLREAASEQGIKLPESLLLT